MKPTYKSTKQLHTKYIYLTMFCDTLHNLIIIINILTGGTFPFYTMNFQKNCTANIANRLSTYILPHFLKETSSGRFSYLSNTRTLLPHLFTIYLFSSKGHLRSSSSTPLQHTGALTARLGCSVPCWAWHWTSPWMGLPLPLGNLFQCLKHTYCKNLLPYIQSKSPILVWNHFPLSSHNRPC